MSDDGERGERCFGSSVFQQDSRTEEVGGRKLKTYNLTDAKLLWRETGVRFQMTEIRVFRLPRSGDRRSALFSTIDPSCDELSRRCLEAEANRLLLSCAWHYRRQSPPGT